MLLSFASNTRRAQGQASTNAALSHQVIEEAEQTEAVSLCRTIQPKASKLFSLCMAEKKTDLLKKVNRDALLKKSPP